MKEMRIEKQAGEIVKSAWEKEFEKGIEKGIKKGKIDDAIRMLELGFDIETIHQITYLSIERIRTLKSKV